MELYFTRKKTLEQGVMKMQKKKFNLSGSVALLISLLILLVFVPINLIISYYDKVYDLTPNRKYTLNPKTVEILDSTTDKHIDVYFLSELRYLQEVPEALPLYHTLTQLDERDNITLTCFNPDEDKELAESLDPSGTLGVEETDIFVKCGDTIKKIDYKKTFTYENSILNYNGEELLASAIYLCTENKLPVVYFVTGYGENTINDEYSVFADEIKADNYSVQELDLSSVDAVPDDACIVYLAGIKKDLSQADRDKLNDYIDNGGSLSVLVPPSDTKGRFENLEYLLAKFELTMYYNLISEANPSNQLTNNEAVQDSKYFRVSYPAFNDEYTVDLTTELNQLVLDGMYVAGISNTRSFGEITSDNAMIEKYPIIENLPNAQDSEEYTALSESKGGDKNTAEDAESQSNQPLELGYYSYNKQTGAKLILIGTDDIIATNSVTITTYGTRMLALFSNTWLYNSDVDMGIGSKANSYDMMHFSGDQEAESALRMFFIAPAVLAVMGVAVWLKRRYA